MRPFVPGSNQQGDVIIAVNGKPVETLSDFAALLEQIGIGNEASLTVRRGDAERQVKVRVMDLQG